MIKREEGFTLIELIITMAITILVLAAASNVFIGLLTQFKQQSKISETNIEGAVGLDILRRDIESAGYGLPWVIPAGVTYDEAVNDAATTHDDTAFNDSTTNPPRAIVSGNNVALNGSDALIIKAVNVATSDASRKWTYLSKDNVVKEWTSTEERLVTSDRVIVLKLGTSDAERRTLVAVGGSFTTRYVASTDPDSLFAAGFAPTDSSEKRIVYGITPLANPVDTALRMPFNRTDYYVRKPASNMPSKCAENTGILYKATVNHNGGGLTELPVLDCVADMQVIFRTDTDSDGTLENRDASWTAGLTAQNIRDWLKEIRVYILAHEGQRDTNFTFSNFIFMDAGSCPTVPAGQCITVGYHSGGTHYGRDFALTTIADYQNYRWKVYSIVIKPNSMR